MTFIFSSDHYFGFLQKNFSEHVQDLLCVHFKTSPEEKKNIWNVVFSGGVNYCKAFEGALVTQLPGRLFSPSDISKKLSHHFLLHFSIGMYPYDHHAKYQWVFMDLK